MSMVIRFINKHSVFWGVVLSVVFIVLGMALLATVYRNADETGAEKGTETGISDGTREGKAATETERERGALEGKVSGLSAKDTQTRMLGELKLREAGKLDVLVAGVSLDNFHSIGNKYAAIYLMKADAVFSVDLRQSEVKWGEDGFWIKVLAPQPEVIVYFDDAETEKIAEWQKSYFSGTAEDGFLAYINSVKELTASASANIEQNETLMESARKAAEQQIQLLAANIYGADVAVSVEFQ